VGRALRSDGNILNPGEVSSDVMQSALALLLLGDGFHSKSRAGVIPVDRKIQFHHIN
jgi:hypothetical protein